MRPVLIDSSFIYAFLNSSDQHHAVAKSVFTELTVQKQLIQIPLPSLLESQRLMLYRKPTDIPKSIRQIKRFSSEFQTLLPTKLELDAAENTISLYLGVKLTLSDALIATMAYSNNARIATFDQDFSILGCDVISV